MLYEPLILVVPPQRLRQIQSLPVTAAHQCYRVGQGPHLFRNGGQLPPRGGLMVMDDRGFDGRGEISVLCDEIVRECAARNFQGVVCDFEQRGQSWQEKCIRQLSERLSRRNWRLYVPEGMGQWTQYGRVMISSALSGGSLQHRLEEAAEKYTPRRITLALRRVAEDFLLPSPHGRGKGLEREELKDLLEKLQPSVFFSHELCTRYFTYTSREDGTHFVLFDDGDTLRKKLQTARGLGITSAMAAWAEVEDVWEQLRISK